MPSGAIFAFEIYVAGRKNNRKMQRRVFSFSLGARGRERALSGAGSVLFFHLVRAFFIVAATRPPFLPSIAFSSHFRIYDNDKPDT